MSRYACLLAVFIFMAASPAFAEKTSYSAAIDDLPLMAGMREIADDAVIFDEPGGRIVETTVVTAWPEEKVKAFYAQVLPPLGWQPAGPEQFRRDDEKLAIAFQATSGENRVRFSITPAR
jgi:hypothetical protein